VRIGIIDITVDQQKPELKEPIDKAEALFKKVLYYS
jgi:hypothetical protein